jgi:hypothetical protein
MQSACAILSSVLCPAVPYFSTLSHKQYDFRGKATEYEICALISVQRLCETFLTRRSIERDSIINIHRSSSKVPVIFVRYLCDLNFRDRFSEKYSNTKFYRHASSRSRVASYGRTDMTKLIVDFRNFANASKNAGVSLKLEVGVRYHWPSLLRSSSAVVSCYPFDSLAFVTQAVK